MISDHGPLIRGISERERLAAGPGTDRRCGALTPTVLRLLPASRPPWDSESSPTRKPPPSERSGCSVDTNTLPFPGRWINAFQPSVKMGASAFADRRVGQLQPADRIGDRVT